MATVELPRYASRERVDESAAPSARGASLAERLLAPVASLRLTVALLALSLFLVLSGTLAQIDYDVWQVLNEYFRTWLTWIPVQLFFPRAWEISDWVGFPFPGGKLIGVALAVNLLAAHGVRFKIAARGGRLASGWILIGVGALVTYAVIASGANTAIESELSATFTNGLWHAVRAALGGAALTLAYILALTWRRANQSAARWTWWFGAAMAVVMISLAAYLFTHPEVRLNASGLRILWQLSKATVASCVLGAGCWMVFGKRAGIVLLHSGVGLLMFSELLTAERAVEAQMRIAEGETATYAEDMRSVELALFTPKGRDTDLVTIVPGKLLEEAARTGKTIDHPELPLAVRVVEYLPNGTQRLIQPAEKNVATAGQGLLRLAEPVAQTSGVDTKQKFDIPWAYVELVSKEGGDSRGVYLLSPGLKHADAVVDGDEKFEVALRFKRVPKEYQVKLVDFKYDRYEGTDTAKNFESIVRFQDPETNTDLPISISMNNPLRYSGDTLYQSSWDPETEAGTVLQVVSNSGWMIPYVACMIVAAGMLVHFTQAIVRFVGRREDEARREAALEGSDSVERRGLLGRWSDPAVWIPALVVLILGGWVAGRVMPARESSTELHVQEFGKLPIAYSGRIQPLDTLARNTLRVISGRETFEEKLKSGKTVRRPAMRWLLDVVSHSNDSRDHQVIRVENLEVLHALGLKPRSGYRYSLAELYGDVTDGEGGELRRQALLAERTPEEKRNITQRAFLTTSMRAQRVFLLRQAFDVPDLGNSRGSFDAVRPAVEEGIGYLNKVQAPRLVAPATPDSPWLTVYEASYNMIRDALLLQKRPPQENATSMLVGMMDDYRAGNVGKFNSGLDVYRAFLEKIAAAEDEHEAKLKAAGESTHRKPAERLELGRLEFEANFNHANPFVLCLALYVVAFVLAATGWLVWPEGFNRAANWLLWLTFAVHTIGLAGRIYISGRPPVTNLYSSALFIGWAAVLLALLFEIIYKMGLGNLLAAALGFPTMVIAYYMTFEADGDTISVMQAVLDTNFWLATHVVCISLGYATTFVAGALGLMTILLGIVGDALDSHQRRQLTRMTYGTLCFAIFFSFIGTILGGLWADDSWGRFWGWDPKENGALMIVLWNALVLHARWGKMCGERGLAALAVIGNIVTAWSWWGVNQMGVGLHAYGETPGRSFWVGIFMVSQLAIVAMAYLTPMLRRIIGGDGAVAAGGA